MTKSLQKFIENREKIQKLNQKWAEISEFVYDTKRRIKSFKKSKTPNTKIIDKLSIELEDMILEREKTAAELTVLTTVPEMSFRYKGHLVKDDGTAVDLPWYPRISSATRSRQWHRSRMMKSGEISGSNSGMYPAASRFFWCTGQVVPVRKQKRK